MVKRTVARSSGVAMGQTHLINSSASVEHATFVQVSPAWPLSQMASIIGWHSSQTLGENKHAAAPVVESTQIPIFLWGRTQSWSCLVVLITAISSRLEVPRYLAR